MAYNPYQTLNDIAWLKNQWEKGDQATKDWASKQAQPLYQQLEQQGYGDLGQQLQNMSAAQATQFKNQPQYKAQGQTGLRDYFEGQGFDVGWNAKTGGVTIGGVPISTQGLTLAGDGRYYGTPEQLQNLSRGVTTQLAEKKFTQGVLNPQQFDHSSDQSYQAYLSATDRAARSNFNRNLANIAARTGGRVSSAAIASAAQGANVAAQQGVDAMGDFEDRYNRQQQQQLQNLAGLYDMQQRAIDANLQRQLTGQQLEGNELTLARQRIDLSVYPEQVQYAMRELAREEQMGNISVAEAEYLLNELRDPNSRTNQLANLDLESKVWELENNKSLAPIERRLLEAQIANTLRQAAGIGVGSVGGSGATGTGATKPLLTTTQAINNIQDFAKQTKTDPITGAKSPLHSKDEIIEYALTLERMGYDRDTIENFLLISGTVTEKDLQDYFNKNRPANMGDFQRLQR